MLKSFIELMAILRTTKRRRRPGSEANHRFELFEDRRLLASGLQNPSNRFDVDSSGLVTGYDALLVINALSDGSGRSSSLDTGPLPPLHYLDVNGDDRVSAEDALSIINALNRYSEPVNLAFSVDPDVVPNANGAVLDQLVVLQGQTIDAIRRADVEGNSATAADAAWTPLINTPPFPTYTSGHSTFSGAADAVLSSFFGANISFATQSDGHSGFSQRPLGTSQIVTRNFTSFAQAADEAGRSRIYGGIHFEFDSSAGLSAGRALGNFVVTSLSVAVE